MLEWAAKKGYANIIQELRARDEQALTSEMKNIALADAAARGHLSCVKVLLTMGAEVSLPVFSRQLNYTPLQCAAFIGHIAIVELLLEGGAAPGAIAGDSSTAVEHAFRNNQEECARYLFSRSTHNELESYLIAAARKDKPGLLRLILSHVFDIGANINGQTVLQYAVARGKKECVRILLEHGVTAKLERLFCTAIVGGHEDIVRLFLEYGADPSSTKHTTHSAYHYAMQCSNNQSPSPILKLLLRSRVEGNTRITDGDNALHHAAHMADVEIVQLLLAKGASVSTPDVNGFKPLHYAAGAGLVAPYDKDGVLKSRMEVIELLLEKGARISDDTNCREHTALDCAIRSCHRDIISFLRLKQEEGHV